MLLSFICKENMLNSRHLRCYSKSQRCERRVSSQQSAANKPEIPQGEMDTIDEV